MENIDTWAGHTDPVDSEKLSIEQARIIAGIEKLSGKPYDSLNEIERETFKKKFERECLSVREEIRKLNLIKENLKREIVALQRLPLDFESAQSRFNEYLDGPFQAALKTKMAGLVNTLIDPNASLDLSLRNEFLFLLCYPSDFLVEQLKTATSNGLSFADRAEAEKDLRHELVETENKILDLEGDF